MALYRMQITSIGRSAGRRATAAAAYRAGERLRDERSGEVFNHSRRKDVQHTEIFLPAHVESAAAGWAAKRESLWNAAEHAEKRRNSRVAREYQVALPHELGTAERIALARALSRELSERYKVAVDLAVHAPRPDGSQRNFHAHLLTTTREVTPTGLGAKVGLDMQPIHRRRHGLPDVRQEFSTLRERWATLTNDALRAANLSVRVDHRSLAAQGIDREPRPSIPIASLKMEQRGVRSAVAERLRAQYRERVQVRQQRTAERFGQRDGASLEPATADARSAAGGAPRDLEEIRRQARERWRQLRSQPAVSGMSEGEREGERKGRERGVAAGRDVDDDAAL